MKIILSLAAFFITLNVYAFTQNANLDFTNLYGNTNAGQYDLRVTFIPKTTKSFSSLTYSTQRDDNNIYCLTTAKFEIGDMLFTLKDIHTGWTFTTTKNLQASYSHLSENETCINDATKFVGLKSLYAQINLNEAIFLPAKGPFGYPNIGAYLNPFNGYLNLNAEIKTGDFELTIDPSQMLTEKNIKASNVQNNSLTYYVFANNESTTTLSLGTGLIKF